MKQVFKKFTLKGFSTHGTPPTINCPAVLFVNRDEDNKIRFQFYPKSGYLKTAKGGYELKYNKKAGCWYGICNNVPIQVVVKKLVANLSFKQFKT